MWEAIDLNIMTHSNEVVALRSRHCFFICREQKGCNTDGTRFLRSDSNYEKQHSQ